MSSIPFIIGSSIISLLVIAANVASYFSERRTYYRLLEESGWVWAGSWSWGFPFPVAMVGLGFDKHSELVPLGLALNIFVWMTAAGLAGIGSVLLAQRFQKEDE